MILSVNTISSPFRGTQIVFTLGERTDAAPAVRPLSWGSLLAKGVHIVSYLSEAPKSTRSYEAYKRAEAAATSDMTLPVPLTMRNAPTKLMKELGYARGYAYNPDYAYVYSDLISIDLSIVSRFADIPYTTNASLSNSETTSF